MFLQVIRADLWPALLFIFFNVKAFNEVAEILFLQGIRPELWSVFYSYFAQVLFSQVIRTELWTALLFIFCHVKAVYKVAEYFFRHTFSFQIFVQERVDGSSIENP